MIERPSLHALAIFLAVVEHGTMTAAAEAEGISQPAISAQIKGLERYYGTTLLQRTVAGSRRPPPGRVADYARRMLALVDELGRVVRDLEGLKTGRLVIGASSTVGEQLLPAYLGRFHAAYPGVDWKSASATPARSPPRWSARELDFAFVGSPPGPDELMAEPVFADGRRLCCPRRSAPARGSRRPGALSGRQYVLRERGSATRDLALDCLAAAVASRPRH